LSEAPRLFVAAPLDEAARAAVEALVERVRAAEPEGRGVRWVRLDGLHLTLRFLGPTSEDRVPDLAAALADAARRAPPMIELRIAGGGAFPSRARPRTLWLAITAGEAALAALAVAVDDALAAAGWPRETRPFRAHLTLARADGVRRGPTTAAALMDAAANLAIDATVDRIVLFESITGGGPARYVARAEASLG